MNIEEWELLKSDLLELEKDVIDDKDIAHSPEELFVDLLLHAEAEKISPYSDKDLTDQEMSKIWASLEPEILPRHLSKRVLRTIHGITTKKREQGEMGASIPGQFALAFRKDGVLDDNEAELVKSAIDDVRNLLRSQEGKKK